MEPEHKRILKERREKIEHNVMLEKIKRYLIRDKMFNKYMWEDIHSVSDVFDLLPSRGPDAFRKFIFILRTANYHEEADSLENIRSPIVTLPSKFIYKMTSNPLGYCLIINNVTFEPKKLKERLGSNVDCTSLKDFFNGIGFDVFVKSDLKKEKMSERIKKFSQLNFKDVDAAILIILSYGAQINNEDAIYGTDGEYIFKKHIIEHFSNANCSQLQGKPKVFFFNTCREENRDHGTPKVFPPESADSTTVEYVPSYTDILIVHSSLPYNISMRDHKKGSWFCQDLISVLKENHSKYDIEVIMKMVNSRLTKRISLESPTTQDQLFMHHVENMAFNSLILCRIPDMGID